MTTPKKNSAYIETSTGNRVHRKSILCGPQRIRLEGKTTIHSNVMLRGDLAKVSIGKLAHVGANTVLRPCHKVLKNTNFTFFPILIGSYTMVGEDCVISAATIGSYVKIGNNVLINERCIIKDCCEILPNSTLAADTVVPPLAIMGGNPAIIVGHLSESVKTVRKRQAMKLFREFKNI